MVQGLMRFGLGFPAQVVVQAPGGDPPVPLPDNSQLDFEQPVSSGLLALILEDF